jgi:hypothetical protein
MSRQVAELKDIASKMEQITDEIDRNIQEAYRLLSRSAVAGDVWDRSRFGWFASIETALHPHGQFTGGPRYRMLDAINELRELAEEYEEMEGSL